jgi:hypothetical protein
MTEFKAAALEDSESEAMRGDDLAEDDNPALIDAHKTFVLSLLGAAMFVGVVISFIL